MTRRNIVQGPRLALSDIGVAGGLKILFSSFLMFQKPIRYSPAPIIQC